jgi:hypothetical protein
MFPWRKEKEDAVYVIGVPMLMGPPTERPVKNIGRSGKHLINHTSSDIFLLWSFIVLWTGGLSGHVYFISEDLIPLFCDITF